MPKIIVCCQQCSKEFVTTAARIKGGRGKFCSRFCATQHTFLGMKRPPRTKEHCRKLGLAHIGQVPWNKGELVKVICEICGKEFSICPGRFKKQPTKFCSRNCQHEAKRRITGTNHPLWTSEQMACEWCGKIVWVKHCKLHEFKYCSRKCQGTSTAYFLAQNYGPTGIEQKLIDEFDKRGMHYFWQYKIASWLVDFAFPSYRLAIEADGKYWHGNEKQKQKDANKDHWLNAHKWSIIRLSEDDINDHIDLCIDKIRSFILIGDHGE